MDVGVFSTAKWLLLCLSSESTYRLFTAPARSLNSIQLTANLNYLAFQVKSCTMVHVILANTGSNTSVDAYHIILGGWSNTRSAIYETNSATYLAVVQTPNILNCHAYTTVWVSWVLYGSQRHIEVGMGNPGNDPFLEAKHNNSNNVHIIQLVPGENETAFWKFKADSSMLSLYNGYISALV